MTLCRPDTLRPALEFCTDGPVAILAGGTDYFPMLGMGQQSDRVLDITAIQELAGIELTDGIWRIGAGVTWSQMVNAPMPRAFDGLKQAGRQVGSVQIQNTGTLVGNICNASPAADGVPALLALNASVEVASLDGSRVVPLAEFITGVRKTTLRDDEIVAAILVPQPVGNCVSVFEKLGSREYLVISIAMVAITLEIDADHTVSGAAVAVGSCSPVACRLPALEADLIGLSVTSGDLVAVVIPAHTAPLSPISDVRGSAEYRQLAVVAMLRRGLSRCSKVAGVK